MMRGTATRRCIKYPLTSKRTFAVNCIQPGPQEIGGVGPEWRLPARQEQTAQAMAPTRGNRSSLCITDRS